MRGQAVLSGKFDRRGFGKVSRIDICRTATLKNLSCTRVEVHVDDRQRLRRRGSSKDGATSAGSDMRDIGERRLDTSEFFASRIDGSEMPDPLLSKRADNLIRRLKRVSRHAECPLRRAKLGIHFAEAFN